MAYPVCDVLTNYQAIYDQEMRETEGENGVISKFNDGIESMQKARRTKSSAHWEASQKFVRYEKSDQRWDEHEHICWF